MAGRDLKSDRGTVRRVAVVGSGVAGMSAALGLCEAGVPVSLVRSGPSLRAASATLRSGFSAALDDVGDSTSAHFEETVIAGRFLAHQPPVRAMTEEAPAVLAWLERLAVPWERTSEGGVARDLSDGCVRPRTAYAGSATGLEVVRALAEQVRQWQARDVVDPHGAVVAGERMLKILEPCDFLGLVLDDNAVAVGFVVLDVPTGKIRALPADAVCLATGDGSGTFARSTRGPDVTADAAMAVFRQGAAFANAELLQVTPTALPLGDKARAVPDRLRALGGRLWVPRSAKDDRRPVEIPEKERDYFLERRFGEHGSLGPADVAVQALLETCLDKGRGLLDPVSGEHEPLVYLDVSHVDRRRLEPALRDWLETAQRWTGVDPFTGALAVGPAVHALLGGLWVDYETQADGTLVEDSPRNQATTIPGLYAAGDVEYQMHGANRLEGNVLPSLVVAGRLAARAMTSYRRALERSAFDLPSSVFDKKETAVFEDQERKLEAARTGDGKHDVFELETELGEALLEHFGPRRDASSLAKLVALLDDLAARGSEAGVGDGSSTWNDGLRHARRLEAGILLARVAALSAQARAPSGGGNAPGEPQRELRSTLAMSDGERVELVAELEYSCAGRTVTASDAVDVRWLSPSARDDGANA